MRFLFAYSPNQVPSMFLIDTLFQARLCIAFTGNFLFCHRRTYIFCYSRQSDMLAFSRNRG